MNTLYFKYAVEVDRTGSITKAAQNLYMAQPNLSKALKDLEEVLGYEVFERTPQGVNLTTRGSLFLSFAKNILEQLDELETIAKEQTNPVQNIKVSIPRGSYIANGFTEFVSELDLEQGIDITIRETNSVHAISDVVEEGHNLGIIRYQTMYENYFLDYLARKNLVYDTLWEFEYVIVMSTKHPLADKHIIEASDLQDYIEICHCDTAIPFIHEPDEKDLRHESPKKKIYVYDRGSQFDLLTNVPQTYMWVSPIPDKYLEQYGLVQRKCKVLNNNYKDLLIYKKGHQLTEMDKKFQMKLYESKVDVSSKVYK